MTQHFKPKISSSNKPDSKGRLAGVIASAPPGQEPLNDYASMLAERYMKLAGDERSSDSYPIRQRLLLDLANMQEGIGENWFWGKWGPKLWPERDRVLVKVRDDLRQIWRLANVVQPSSRKRLGSASETSYHSVLAANQILNRWLAWRPSAKQESAYREVQGQKFQVSMFPEDQRDYKDSQWALPTGYVPFFCWLPTRELLPDTRALRPMLIQGIFEHWGRLKYCSNVDCVTPYFVARRKDQRVCDAEVCKAEKQREHARKWWSENRAAKVKSQNEAGAKETEKGSEDNVTGKAR
jgi:hypothetical protein